MNELMEFEGTHIQILRAGDPGREQRVITLAAVADATGMDRETLRNIIRRNPDVFEGWVWSVTLTDHLGRLQPTTVLGRDGVLALLLKINTNQLENEDRRQRIIRFQRWAAQVLGEVVETGSYSVAPQFHIPQTYAEALRLAADQAEQIERQQETIRLLEPKAEFHDRVAAVEDGQPVAQVAKVLGTGEVRFFRWLRENGILLTSPWNVPRQEYLDRGYFILRQRVWRDKQGNEHPAVTTLVTGKGLTWLQKRWDADNPRPTALRVVQ